MSAFCGLDFGTSNSTVGIIRNRSCQLVPLENNRPTLRSAIFCDAEHKQWIFGQEGVTRYLESTPGRLMMALKSVLGSSLMDDTTLVFNEFVTYTDILGHFVKHIKQHAEQYAEQELTQVVLGRPVRFHDQDVEKDRAAQNTLETIAHKLGFKDVVFQYEPIAAALAYEATISTEKLALIVDMGGGTSDFTIIRLRPGINTSDRSHDVLANCGIHIAGTDFDQKLSLNSIMPLLGMGSLMAGSSSQIEVPSAYYYDLTSWHALTQLYNAKTMTHIRSIQTVAQEKMLIGRLLHVLQLRGGHHILDAVEKCKQRLSEEQEVLVDLDFIEHELAVAIQRKTFNDNINEQLQQIIQTILQTVKIANVKSSDINTIFYTGGSTKIPFVREQINALFPDVEVVEGDAFGSVGIGLTIDAERRFA